MLSWLLSNDEVVKNLGQAAAWLAAAVFFGWKLAAGYSVINLSVALRLERFRSPHGDRIRVRVELTKGDRATLRISEIAIRVLANEDIVLAQSFPEAKVERGGSFRPLRITPGESTHFERSCLVPRDAIVSGNLVIRGAAFFRGEWRASAVSVPEDCTPIPVA